MVERREDTGAHWSDMIALSSFATLQLCFLVVASVLVVAVEAPLIHWLGRRGWGRSFVIAGLGLVPFYAVIASTRTDPEANTRRLATIRRLIELGADPDLPSPLAVHYTGSPNEGKFETPMEVARRLGDGEVVEILCEAGAVEPAMPED